MTTFKTAMAALDLTPNDEALLTFSSYLSRPFQMEKIYFLHIIPDFTQPGEMDEELRQILQPVLPVDEQIRDRLKKEVEAHFGEPSGVEQFVDVVEGKPYQKMIHWVDVKNVELLIAGNKKVNKGAGIAVRRVARNAPCNVLFVPENTRPSIRRIMVPVDFSDNSSRALRVATDLKKNLPDVTVTTVHIVPQPAAVYYAPEFNDPRFSKLLMQTARESQISFMQKNRIAEEGVKEEFIEDTYANIPRHIAEYAQTHGFDLIIMGATGHSAFNNLFFSSLTESMIERCKETSILVVR